MDELWIFIGGVLLAAIICKVMVVDEYERKLAAEKSQRFDHECRAKRLQKIVNELRTKLAEHGIPGLTDEEADEAERLY